MSNGGSLFRLEYLTLVAEFQEAAVGLSNKAVGAAERRRFSTLIKQFFDDRQALAKRHGIFVADLDDPPAITEIIKRKAGAFDDVTAALDSIAYWFDKLEGREPNDAEVNQYLAARHSMGRTEAMSLTLSELAELLRTDYLRLQTGDAKRDENCGPQRTKQTSPGTDEALVLNSSRQRAKAKRRELTVLDRAILQVLMESEAHAPSAAVSSARIAVALDDNTSPASIRQRTPILQRAGLIRTLEGPQGGCYLTAKGRRKATSQQL